MAVGFTVLHHSRCQEFQLGDGRRRAQGTCFFQTVRWTDQITKIRREIGAMDDMG